MIVLPRPTQTQLRLQASQAIENVEPSIRVHWFCTRLWLDQMYLSIALDMQEEEEHQRP